MLYDKLRQYSRSTSRDINASWVIWTCILSLPVRHIHIAWENKIIWNSMMSFGRCSYIRYVSPYYFRLCSIQFVPFRVCTHLGGSWKKKKHSKGPPVVIILWWLIYGRQLLWMESPLCVHITHLHIKNKNWHIYSVVIIWETWLNTHTLYPSYSTQLLPSSTTKSNDNVQIAAIHNNHSDISLLKAEMWKIIADWLPRNAIFCSLSFALT